MRELHELGIFHRDLKPSNIVKSNSAWKLADFGLAKNAVRLMTQHTQQGSGTLGYAPPEQWESVEARASADVYSFGKVITFMLTGETDPDQIEQPTWRALVWACTDRDPKLRPDLNDVLIELEKIPV